MASERQSKQKRRPRNKQEPQALQRRIQCLQLRCQGKTYAEIAAEVGIDQANAYRHVSKALAQLREDCQEQAIELRAIEHQRLEKLYARIWAELDQDGIDPGDVAKLSQSARQVSESIRKLWGLDYMPDDDGPEEHTPVAITLKVNGESQTLYDGANGHA